MSLFFVMMATSAPSYNLDGQVISDTSTSRTCTAGVRFNADGTVDQLTNATYAQIDPNGDWVTPNHHANEDHDVRITNVVWTSGAAFDTEAAAEDVWIDLGSNREWIVIDSTSSAAGVKIVDFDVEIRDAAGTTVATGSYQLTADYNNA